MKKSLNLLLVTLVVLLVSVNANAQPKKEIEKVVYKVNIHCDDCKKKIEKSIPFEKGVKDLSVDMKEHKVAISFDPTKTSADKIKKALEKLKFKVSE